MTYSETLSYLETARRTELPYATVRGIVRRLAGSDGELAKARQDIREAMAEEAADRAMELLSKASEMGRRATAQPKHAAHAADALARAGASAARIAETLSAAGKGPVGPTKLEVTFHGGDIWAAAPGSGHAPPDAGGTPPDDDRGGGEPLGGSGPVPGDGPGGAHGGDGPGP